MLVSAPCKQCVAPKLTRGEILDWYDGPLLVRMTDEEGYPGLFSWVDCDKEVNQWLYFRTTDALVEQFLQGKVTLRHVILHPEGPWLVFDLGKEDEPKRVFEITEIPESHLPTLDSFVSAEESSL